MVKLKRFKLGDKIFTTRWKSPFVVEVIYKGWVVAVNRKSTYNAVFLFIRTYTGEVYFGSSRFMKYGVNGKNSIKSFIDDILKGAYVLEKDNCVPMSLILTDSAFEKRERREQVKYGD